MISKRTLEALQPVVEGIKRMRAPLVRAAAAHAAAAALREVETQLCWIRDNALRDDRRSHPEHTVDRVAHLTGIGPATVVNARRVSRPPRYARRDLT
jgi:hypothetical protein